MVHSALLCVSALSFSPLLLCACRATHPPIWSLLLCVLCELCVKKTVNRTASPHKTWPTQRIQGACLLLTYNLQLTTSLIAPAAPSPSQFPPAHPPSPQSLPGADTVLLRDNQSSPSGKNRRSPPATQSALSRPSPRESLPAKCPVSISAHLPPPASFQPSAPPSPPENPKLLPQIHLHCPSPDSAQKIPARILRPRCAPPLPPLFDVRSSCC